MLWPSNQLLLFSPFQHHHCSHFLILSIISRQHCFLLPCVSLLLFSPLLIHHCPHFLLLSDSADSTVRLCCCQFSWIPRSFNFCQHLKTNHFFLAHFYTIIAPTSLFSPFSGDSTLCCLLPCVSVFGFHIPLIFVTLTISS